MRAHRVLRLLPVLVPVLFSPALAAQLPGTPSPAGTIVGIAVSDATGGPLASVAVTFRRMPDSTVVAGTVTDAAGRFVREGLAPGEYRVELTSVGHAPAGRDGIRVTGDALRHDLGTIRLGVAVVELEGVTAEARGAAVTFETDRSVYHVREMPTVQGGMATDALRAIPELEVDVDDNIRARGGTPEIYLDGRPLPMQGEARTAFLRSLRADRIERVEFIPNPSARYEAEGQSGIVNIVLRRDVGLGFSGSLSANAGTRGTQNLSSRLNYQRGLFTFFGGGLIGLTNTETSTLDFRQNLTTDPVTAIEQATDRETDRRNSSGDLTTEMKISDRTTAWLIGRANWSDSDDSSLSLRSPTLMPIGRRRIGTTGRTRSKTDQRDIRVRWAFGVSFSPSGTSSPSSYATTGVGPTRIRRTCVGRGRCPGIRSPLIRTSHGSAPIPTTGPGRCRLT